MAHIKVHLLNFHNIVSHVAIVLEDNSTDPHTYYEMDRWKEPEKDWNQQAKAIIDRASSIYSFNIEANPEDLVKKWTDYWNNTKAGASALGDNCAVATQWFLSEFANIPQPDLSNISTNHFILGTVWPSFIPCPFWLPGRVMSNAQFYLEARNHPEIASHYSKLFLYTSILLAALTLAASINNIASASSTSEYGLLGIVSSYSSYVFFKSMNLLSAKKIADKNDERDKPQYSGVLEYNPFG